VKSSLDPPVIKFPQSFEVKYLGRRDAGGLWGIKVRTLTPSSLRENWTVISEPQATGSKKLFCYYDT